MNQLYKDIKTILVPYAYPTLPVYNLTLDLVGTNIYKYDIKFVTTTLAPLSL